MNLALARDLRDPSRPHLTKQVQDILCRAGPLEDERTIALLQSELSRLNKKIVVDTKCCGIPVAFLIYTEIGRLAVIIKKKTQQNYATLVQIRELTSCDEIAKVFVLTENPRINPPHIVNGKQVYRALRQVSPF